MNIALVPRNEMLDAGRARYNNGYARVYNGVKPTNADTALSGNTLLAELRFAATAFPAASGGVLTANALTADSVADASGTPTFVRCFESNGTTVISDLTAGVGSGEANFASLITAGNRVEITSLTVSIPA